MSIEQEGDRGQKPLRPLPDPTLLERFDEAGRAAAGAALGGVVPAGGEFFATFVGQLLPSIRTRRTDAWFEELRVAINYLSKHSLRAEDLHADPAFHDIVCDATEAARRTHLDEKREALRNAVVNAGMQNAPSRTKQHMFVRLIDEFNELHLGLLALMANPAGWFRDRGGELPRDSRGGGMNTVPEVSEARLEAVLQKAFPDFANDLPLLMLVIAELEQKGLIEDIDQRHRRPLSAITMMPPLKTFAAPLGREFLRFISAPPAPAG